MYSVYFVVSEYSLSDRIRSVIDFPRFDLQYFGTEYHSALALRLAIVAKPQIIVLDSDGKQQMIYKHAISTIIPMRPIDFNATGD